MKLILFPLIVLLLFAFLSMFGLGSSDLQEFSGSLYDRGIGAGGYDGWYDSTGHMVVFNNGTPAGENGRFKASTGGYFFQPAQENSFHWYNGTFPFDEEWDIFNTPNGVNSIAYADTSFSVNDSLGLIVLVGAVMALATIAGVRVMGSGVSDTSVSTLVIGSALITLWLVFSIMAMPLITQIPLFGNLFYFGITLLYTVGIISRIGGSGT